MFLSGIVKNHCIRVFVDQLGTTSMDILWDQL